MGVEICLFWTLLSLFSFAKCINKVISMKEGYFETKHEKLRSRRPPQKQRKGRNWSFNRAQAKQPQEIHMKDFFKKYINSVITFTELSRSQAKRQHLSGTKQTFLKVPFVLSLSQNIVFCYFISSGHFNWHWSFACYQKKQWWTCKVRSQGTAYKAVRWRTPFLTPLKVG